MDVPIFEVKAHNNIILRGLNLQSIVFLNDKIRNNEEYSRLKIFGIIEEGINGKGSWEYQLIDNQ